MISVWWWECCLGWSEVKRSIDPTFRHLRTKVSKMNYQFCGKSKRAMFAVKTANCRATCMWKLSIWNKERRSVRDLRTGLLSSSKTWRSLCLKVVFSVSEIILNKVRGKNYICAYWGFLHCLVTAFLKQMMAKSRNSVSKLFSRMISFRQRSEWETMEIW